MSRFISIDFSAIDNIISELQGISDRASDLKPVASLVALVISSYTDDVFKSAPKTRDGGIVFNGESWEPLTEKYLKARRKLKKKSKNRDNGYILRDTGALLNSLLSRSESKFYAKNTSTNAFEYGSDFIEFGTNLPQGYNNNKRPFLAHTDSLSELVEKVIENYILTGET